MANYRRTLACLQEGPSLLISGYFYPLCMAQLWYVLPYLPPSFLISHPQIPQLWASCLQTRSGNEVLTQRVSTIAQIEADKEREASQKADEHKTLAEAKKQGKEAYAAAKAQITQEQTAAAEAKKIEKLRIAAEHQAEKARLAAENKAKQAERKVFTPFLSDFG